MYKLEGIVNVCANSYHNQMWQEVLSHAYNQPYEVSISAQYPDIHLQFCYSSTVKL